MTLTRDGWSDAELYTLLTMLKIHMTEYIYQTDQVFAESFLKLRHKRPQDAIDMLRQIMSGFRMALDTRAFRNEVITVNDQPTYMYEHLYETVQALPENRKGGVWHPDELRKQLARFKLYRDRYDLNEEKFFERTLIWGKSNSVDARAKFYLWRDLYMDDVMKEADTPLSAAELCRKSALQDTFANVPAAPSPLPAPPTPIHHSTDSMKRLVPVPLKKHSRTRPWTSEDQESLTQSLVDITLEIQKSGHSTIATQLPHRFGRTAQALICKVQHMRSRYEDCARSTAKRPANLPSVLFDESSVAYRIFNADWNDRDDPYALGVFAMKAAVAYVSRTKLPLPPMRMELRLRSGGIATSVSPQTPLTHSGHKSPTAQSNSQSPSGSAPRSEFVRDCALLVGWSEDQTHVVCEAMQDSMHLYEDVCHELFFRNVAALAGNCTLQQVRLRGYRILRLCQQRFGSLACFQAAVEGSQVQWAADGGAPQSIESPEAPLAEPEASPAISATPVASHQSSPDQEQTTIPCQPVQATQCDTLKQTYGKSNEAAQQFLHQRTGHHIRERQPHSDSSPSIQPFSPGYLDDDELIEDTDSIDEGQGDGQHDGDEDTRSLVSGGSTASRQSSDYGSEAVYRSRVHRSYGARSHATPSTVHVAAHKTVVVKHSDYDRRRRRHKRHHRDPAYSKAAHHHRESHRYHRTYSYTDVRHEITHHTDAYSSDDAMSAAEVNELNALWAGLRAPVEQNIADLEAKLREQEERAHDRAQREQKLQWKQGLRQQAMNEYLLQRQGNTRLGAAHKPPSLL